MPTLTWVILVRDMKYDKQHVAQIKYTSSVIVRTRDYKIKHI